MRVDNGVCPDPSQVTPAGSKRGRASVRSVIVRLGHEALLLSDKSITALYPLSLMPQAKALHQQRGAAITIEWINMHYALTIATATLLTLVSACAGPTSRPAQGIATSEGSADQSRPPDHVWRSDGYGWIITLTGTREKTYDITAISCLPHPALDQVGQPAADGTVGYGTNGVPSQTLRQRQDGHAMLHVMGTAADVDLLPLPALPAPCTRPVPNDPQTNFDVLWQTFAENYNSFPRKNVNWTALRNQYRPQVTASTTPKELFKILSTMITPLGDAHANIEEPNGNSFSPKRPGTRDEDDVSHRDATKQVDRYLEDSLHVTDIQNFAKNKISYADLPGGRGYLRITSFEGYRGADTPFVGSRDELRQVLDTIFTQQRVNGWHGLVIDDRFNSGGDDALGLQVAARLTNAPYPAYAKQPRNDPLDPSRHGRLQSVSVTPANAPRYTGPVFLLTSDLTVSAGETFVEATMGRTPAPVRIGTPTLGVFSDDMTRLLPNGWTFTLGNEEYYASDGRDYEGLGVPPNISTPVFTDEENTQHRDSALDTALHAPAP
jgi:hypothetical protein